MSRSQVTCPRLSSTFPGKFAYFLCHKKIIKIPMCIYSYLLHELGNDPPRGVSRFSVLYALAKQAKNLGAFKLAR